MGTVINMNNGRYQCEACESWFDPEMEDYGTDEDGNYFCKNCCESFPESSGWGLFQDYPDQWHIRPVDESDHIHDTNICSCKPRLEVENGIDIYIHNSFDGREGLENALEILNQHT